MYGLFMCFDDGDKRLIGVNESHEGIVLVANTALSLHGLTTTWDDDLRVSTDIVDPEVDGTFHYEVAVSVEN